MTQTATISSEVLSLIKNLVIGSCIAPLSAMFTIKGYFNDWLACCQYNFWWQVMTDVPALGYLGETVCVLNCTHNYRTIYHRYSSQVHTILIWHEVLKEKWNAITLKNTYHIWLNTMKECDFTQWSIVKLGQCNTTLS